MTKQHPTEQLLERYYYQGWNKASESVLADVLDEKIEFRGSFRRKPVRGIAAFAAYMHKAHKALANNTIHIQDVVISDNGRKAAVRLTNRGIHRGDFFGVQGSGHEVAWGSAAFFTLNESCTKITELWVLGDIDGLKNQIGAPVESIAFSV